MKVLKMVLFSILLSALFSSLALAAGDAAKGKRLFNDAKLGTAGNSCNSCHPDGKGLEKAGARKDLAKVVNSCIENALKGKPIDTNSSEMSDLIAYIKSLKGKGPETGVPKKK